jgi:hypothetical protein
MYVEDHHLVEVPELSVGPLVEKEHTLYVKIQLNLRVLSLLTLKLLGYLQEEVTTLPLEFKMFQCATGSLE